MNPQESVTGREGEKLYEVLLVNDVQCPVIDGNLAPIANKEGKTAPEHNRRDQRRSGGRFTGLKGGVKRGAWKSAVRKQGPWRQ